MGKLSKVAEKFKSGNKAIAGKKAQSKFAKVMSEFKHGGLHMGKTGKLVPRGRRDIAMAIAASEAKKASRR